MNDLENIKKILESDAGLLVEGTLQPTNKKVVDNRFLLIKQNVDSIENKDDNFYAKLIKLLANYIDQLYDKKVEYFPSIVFDKNGEITSQDYDELNSSDMFQLTNANRELSGRLFDYVCNVLESNKDIKLDIETFKRLLNRNPKLSALLAEESYLYRPFDYKKIVKIINENQLLKKSNININEIYQLLLDTCQLNNDDVFGSLINPEQFNQNHQKIDEILTWCNAKTFVEITNIIRRNFDKNFDRFNIVKKRNKNKFCERIIIELLNWYVDKDDCDLIHKILTDPEIEIDYDLYVADYIGQTDLKSIIALSGNRIIIKDLLSKKQNIQNYFWHGESIIQLYRLYGIIGDYEKALTNFNENYNYRYDYIEDFNDDFNRVGYTYGGWSYEDSVAEFIKDICASFSDESIDYPRKKEIISQILNNDKVKYINLEETLPVLQEVLLYEDFKALLDTLILKRNAGNLEFIVVTENDDDSFYNRYIIKVATAEEVQNCLVSLSQARARKVLSLV